MDLFAFPPIAALLSAAYHLFTWLTTVLTPLAGTFAAAAAVILVTLVVRAALIPMGISGARAEQTRSRLAPRLRAIQQRHRKNPERMQREISQLYRDENASPFAGILPLLAQAPIVGIIYAVFLHATIGGQPNALLTEDLLGVPLGTSFFGAIAHGALDPQMILVFAVPVAAIAVIAELTRRAFRPAVNPDAGPLASRGAAGLMGVLQFITAGIALFVPLAAALYLVVTVTWTYFQRRLLRRRFPLEPAT